MNKALFLDRDGVINIDHGYVCRKENFEFVEGIFDLCRQAKAQGYLLVVITNQAGIGRGYYTEEDFSELMGWVKQRFADEHAEIDAVYFCPDHPEKALGSYKKFSLDRKPGPGMLLKAAKDLNVDLETSIFIGDSVTDVYAGCAAGVGRMVFLGDELPSAEANVCSFNDLNSIKNQFFATEFKKIKGSK